MFYHRSRRAVQSALVDLDLLAKSRLGRGVVAEWELEQSLIGVSFGGQDYFGHGVVKLYKSLIAQYSVGPPFATACHD